MTYSDAKNLTWTQDRKQWERFRELPEWIQSQASTRAISPQSVIDELEQMRNRTSGKPMGLNALTKEVKKLRFANVQAKSSGSECSSESASPCMPLSDLPPDLQLPPATAATTTRLPAKDCLLPPTPILPTVAPTVISAPAQILAQLTGKKRRAAPIDARRKKKQAS